MDANITIYIPTRDSGRWIGRFLDEYRKVGIEPLYIVDSRTTDNTAEVLKNKNANFYFCSPHGDFAEAGMVSFAYQKIETAWSLRLDDDEFPSSHLIRHLGSYCAHSDVDAWWIPRREICFAQGRLVYSRFPTAYSYMVFDDTVRKVISPQLRLVRNAKAEISEGVHTPGVKIPSSTGIVEDCSFFIHCKNIMTSPTERLLKVRRYAVHDPIKAWSVVHEYLPEILDGNLFDFCEDGLAEFDALLRRLPKPSANEKNIAPSEQEIEFATKLLLERFADIIGLVERQHNTLCTELATTKAFLKPVSPLLRRLSELLLTIARLTHTQRLRIIGERLHKVARQHTFRRL